MNLRPAALLLLVLVSCSLAAFAPAARAAVHETLDHGHYDVRAQPGRKLSLALNQASPFRPDGQVFHSATAWNLDWQVRPAPTSDGRCRVAEVQVQLRGEMMLPRLLGGDRAQRSRFESYLERLREHELGHFEIGREAARQLEKQFLALPPASDCSALHAAARGAGARLLARYEAMGDAYDRQTQHGRTQGAWLVD